MFFQLGFDKDNYDRPNWNPLKNSIIPGNHVFIKPNLVYHNLEQDALITHGSIIRAVLDYVSIALNGEGKITIGDSPVQGANFEIIKERSGLNSILNYYKKTSDIEINVVDLRKEWVITDVLQKSIIKRNTIRDNNSDYVPVQLGKNSEFFPISEGRKNFKVSMYPSSDLYSHHHGLIHEYLVSKDVLDADVIINLPKLKTHRIAGITAGLKNLIGINGDKNWIPHYSVGSVREGGDEYLHKNFRKKVMAQILEEIDSSSNPFVLRVFPILYHLIKASSYLYPFKDHFYYGAWYGNDTVFRSTLDLNKIIFYADKKGEIQGSRQRKMFVLVDAVVAGEGEGPLKPTPKKFNVLLAGDDPLAVDIVCCTLMGFDHRKIPTLNHGLKVKDLNLCQHIKNIAVVSNFEEDVNQLRNRIGRSFEPASSWKGHIEYE